MIHYRYDDNSDIESLAGPLDKVVRRSYQACMAHNDVYVKYETLHFSAGLVVGCRRSDFTTASHHKDKFSESSG